jgi:hypothetical protein
MIIVSESLNGSADWVSLDIAGNDSLIDQYVAVDFLPPSFQESSLNMALLNIEGMFRIISLRWDDSKNIHSASIQLIKAIEDKSLKMKRIGHFSFLDHDHICTLYQMKGKLIIAIF